MARRVPMAAAECARRARDRRLVRTGAALGVLAAVLAALALLPGCAAVGYYAQSVHGHLSLMHAARPVGELLADGSTPDALKARLALAQRMRAFAVTGLALPDNASYHRYSDLKRPAAVWNVAAAPADSLVLRRWCFPVVGCVGYRGYYDEGAARALAAQLEKDEGLEVRVYGIPAYSTLGWLNWAGGDPLLSTFIHWPEGELARMLFHELAHQVVYVNDDTMFNESYATAVERLGVAQWLRTQAGDEARAAYAALDARRHGFRALGLRTREELEALYAQRGVLASDVLHAGKAEVMARFRARYAALKAEWAAEGRPFDGYDTWVAQANNAFFGVQAAYDGLVPGFEALFAQVGGDWPRFHAAVAELARHTPDERRARLAALTDDK
ncbi:MAG: aminopeptidase [Pseudomonadota bacterium]|nr:aminopeptidase [Pseudomonadota bacterium]